MDDDCDEAIDESLTCTGSCTPTGAEVCNGVDDDCNGLVDETDPAMGTACGESMGTCMPGTMRCVGGMLTCIGGTGPRDEVCNGLDDDCDGIGDDDAPCPVGSMCIEGACRRPCDPVQEFPCPVGFVCEMPAGVDGTYCLPTPCGTCAAGERCVDDVCVDPCEGVSCGEGEECRDGECLDCRRLGCPSGAICFGGTCQPHPCEGVTCAASEACVMGTCQPACGPSDCAAGQRCSASGSCEDDPCAGMSCDPGRVCVDDPCLVVRCPSGRTCQADARGVALCVAMGMPDAGVEPDFVSAGGATCAIGPPGGSRAGVTLLFIALAAVLFVRRRRA
jgi:hypothetical protein